MMLVGRYAPSPTGLMHYGNAMAALASWLDVRREGGRWLLRIEDLDRERCHPQYVDSLMEDLRWLGLEWDNQGSEVFQSERSELYRDALTKLDRQGLIYRCFCTRAQMASISSAPQGEQRYGVQPVVNPCRTLTKEEAERRLLRGERASCRLILPDEPDSYYDCRYGLQSIGSMSKMIQGGDPILQRSDGMWAYQLAVSVDDMAMGVTLVTRGMDLLESAHIQRFIIGRLGGEPPRYSHIPLYMGADGVRLAKRNGGNDNLTVSYTRNVRGIKPGNVLAHLAVKLGLLPDTETYITLNELLDTTL
ncbi:MAG: tRNA glutamyl-Q(34) synthetase GluQRS [Marinilabiliaceae bacterium]|nr:tRNA glutamyl-Q(34) synthetase GluQRS [Marinilabiliaceae bacterium]